jgi:hypothetical protein
MEQWDGAKAGQVELVMLPVMLDGNQLDQAVEIRILPVAVAAVTAITMVVAVVQVEIIG